MTPLAGRRVLVTRPREQATELVERLRALGADTILAPLIRIEAPSDPVPLRQAAERAHDFDWIVLTSVNAVEGFARALAEVHPRMRSEGLRFCAIGPATAAALRKHGLQVDLMAEEARAEGVVAALATRGSPRGRSFLIPRADIGRDHVARELSAAGALVTEVIAYRTVSEHSLPEQVHQSLKAGLVDVVTFTSASAVRSFASILGEDSASLLRPLVVAVIGPTTGEAAVEAGFNVTIQPPEYTISALVDAIVRHYTN